MKNIDHYLNRILEYAEKNYQRMFREPDGYLKYQFLVPGSCYDNCLWDWDSWLTNIALRQFVTRDISDYENSLYSYDKINFLDTEIQEIRNIEKKLENMKEIDKTIFLDFYYSSKSIKDIAKEQKMSEFSVKQRLYRIRNKIKKEVR